MSYDYTRPGETLWRLNSEGNFEPVPNPTPTRAAPRGIRPRRSGRSPSCDLRLWPFRVDGFTMAAGSDVLPVQQLHGREAGDV